MGCEGGGANLPAEPGPIPVQTAIADLQARLAVAEALADERKGALDVGRAKTEHFVGEIADLARQLARIVDEAGGRERELQARVASADTALATTRDELAVLQRRAETDAIQARDELAAWKARPWWRRMAG